MKALNYNIGKSCGDSKRSRLSNRKSAPYYTLGVFYLKI